MRSGALVGTAVLTGMRRSIARRRGRHVGNGLQPLLVGHLLREARSLDAVAQPFAQSDELGLNDVQIAARQRLIVQWQRHWHNLVRSLRSQTWVRVLGDRDDPLRLDVLSRAVPLTLRWVHVPILHGPLPDPQDFGSDTDLAPTWRLRYTP